MKSTPKVVLKLLTFGIVEQVSNLTKLKELTITGNELRQLPAELGCVTSLEKVRVCPRKLRFVAVVSSRREARHRKVVNLSKVDSPPKLQVNVDSDNEHLRNPPPEIVKEGAAAIVEYLKEMYQARFTREVTHPETRKLTLSD